MFYDFLHSIYEIFYCALSPIDLDNNFFQVGLVILLVLLIINFFKSWFIKNI